MSRARFSHIKSFLVLVWVLAGFAAFGVPTVSASTVAGSIEPGFAAAIGSGFSSYVYAITPQSDGQLIVGGAFTSFNGASTARLARISASGTLDTAFAANMGTGFNNSVMAVLVQSDGKILAGGNFSSFNGSTTRRLVRLNSNGTPDTAFNANVLAVTEFTISVSSIAVQPDGKIIVVGDILTLPDPTSKRILRFNSDGTLDSTFYSNVGTDVNSPLNTVLLQQDGKILIGGSFTDYNGTTANRFTRLNASGTLDTAFNANLGTGFSSTVLGAALQPDGNILVGGTYSTLNGVMVSRVSRVSASGTPDSSFNTALSSSGLNMTAYTISLINGQILAGGSYLNFGASSTKIARFSTDGILDSSFEQAAGSGFDNIVRSIVGLPNGNLLIGGLFTSFNGTPAGYITVLNGTTTDTDSPAISAVSASTTDTSATVTWTTDEPSDSRVVFSIGNSYASSTSLFDTSPMVTSHSVLISSLLPCFSYNMRAVSTDASSNTGTSTGSVFVTGGCLASSTPQSATSTLTSSVSGGTSTLAEASTTLTVAAPANFTSTSTEVVIQIKSLESAPILSALGTPSGSRISAGNIVFDVKALVGTETVLDTFDVPIVMSYHYSDDQVAGLDESTLRLYHYHDGAWTALSSCSVDTDANVVTCSTLGFSVFALFGQAAQVSAQSSGGVTYSSGGGGGGSGGSAIIYSNAAVSTSTATTSTLSVRIQGTDDAGCIAGAFFSITTGQRCMFVVSTSGTGVNASIAAAKTSSTRPVALKYKPNKDVISLQYRDLTIGKMGADVKELQVFLNNNGFTVSNKGLGSKGNESFYFGPATRAALARFQEAAGITPASGYFGNITKTYVLSR